SVASRLVVILPEFIKPRFEPVLEMKLFVVPAFALDQDIRAHGSDTMFENSTNETHRLPPVFCCLLVTCSASMEASISGPLTSSSDKAASNVCDRESWLISCAMTMIRTSLRLSFRPLALRRATWLAAFG